ncbi:MAG: hypothetical protein AAFY88_24590, partial [Acidobacteriota bacterium]
RVFRRALEVDRLGANPNAALALFHYCRRAYDAADAQLKVTEKIHPDFGPLWLEVARLHDVRGDHSDAVAALERARELMGDESEILAGLVYNLARAGEHARAVQLRAELASRTVYISPYHHAVAALGFEDLDGAARHLAGSWRDRSLWLPWLRFDHRLAPLHTRGDVIGLLGRLNLPRPKSP